MERQVIKRKRPKPGQRLRVWSHGLKNAALGLAGGGIARSVRNLPARAPREEDVRGWLADAATADAYRAFRDRTERAEAIRRESTTQGDGFALFAIARGVGAGTALEIGTNLGYSTLFIAAGLSAGGGTPKVTTVDILDVNDEARAVFKTHGAEISARRRLELAGLADRAEFVVSRSDAYLRRARGSYDLIFIDGDHSEIGAYFDILYSLPLLGPRGVVVLHDYHNPHRLAAGEKTQFGVYWAIERLRALVPDLDAVALRSVTVPDRAPEQTSLAVLTRRGAAA